MLGHRLWAPDTGVPVWRHSGMVPNDLCGKEGKVLRVQEAKDCLRKRSGNGSRTRVTGKSLTSASVTAWGQRGAYLPRAPPVWLGCGK